MAISQHGLVMWQRITEQASLDRRASLFLQAEEALAIAEKFQADQAAGGPEASTAVASQLRAMETANASITSDVDATRYVPLSRLQVISCSKNRGAEGSSSLLWHAALNLSPLARASP